MKPYLVIAAEFKEGGGMDRANLELVRFAADRGHPVHLVAHSVNLGADTRGNFTEHHVARPLGFGILGERALNIAAYRIFSRLPKGTRIVTNGGNCSLPAVNWVHYVHKADISATQAFRSRISRALAVRTERVAFDRARLLVANSYRTRTELIRHYEIPTCRIGTLYCGVESKRFFPVDESTRRSLALSLGLSPDLRRMIFLGQLTDDRKGFSILFDAWRILAAEFHDIELVVVGAGRMLNYWRERAAVHGLKARVRFLGKRTDVSAIMQASDLLVAPSRYESYGLNIAEALSVGLPAVATVSSGACELIRGQLRELLVADPPSVFGVVAALRKWRAERERFHRSAVEASVSIRAHSWQEMSRRMYSLIEGSFEGGAHEADQAG
jgi:glycosyltransferase involved in cell wall biosynthesis